MHFALPPRRTSNPAPYLPRSSRHRPSLLSRLLLRGLRRTRTKLVALAGLAFIALVYFLTRSGSGGDTSGGGVFGGRVPSGKPPVVLVTVLDEKRYSREYLETVKENRRGYAERHGYETFFARVGDYDLKGAPRSWTSVVAVRHALTQFPNCRYVWFLEQNAFIMNPKTKIDEDVLQASKLDELMKKDFPVVPPDSIIKTFSHLKGQDVGLVVTQDQDGLSAGSFVVKNGEWARFFLETWWNPLYRSYNFQKAEAHALEHIVQWHPTILAQMAIIDQSTINAYSKDTAGAAYKEGDLVVRLAGCAAAGKKACETEARPFVQKWRAAFADT
ncbi:hypothetical protein VTK26DRAFT_413 [Humicola hyalothermophila]